VEEIVTGDAVVLDLPCARFPTRMLAHLIDMLIQVPLLLVILGLVGFAADSGLNSAWVAAIFVTGYVLVVVGYPLIFETLSRGRTPGKMALGLRIVADDGGPERFRQALVRALAGAIECWVLIGVPALITSLFSSRGKRLGDIFAGTFALRERAPRAAMVNYPAPAYPGAAYPGPAFPAAGGIVPPMTPPLIAWAASLDLSALPDHLAASATSYLTRYIDLHSPAREQLGLQLAADIAARVSPAPPPGMPPVYFLGVVLAERRRREYARLAPPPTAGYTAAPFTPPPAPPAASAAPPASTASAPDPGFAPPV
jgi:uncharacterized RDD family membrane protein YckC